MLRLHCLFQAPFINSLIRSLVTLSLYTHVALPSVLQVLILILSHIKDSSDLHSFLCTAKSMRDLASDTMLQSTWLFKHQPQALAVAARKRDSNLMLQLLRMGVSATDVVGGSYPLVLAATNDLPEVVAYLWNCIPAVKENVKAAEDAMCSAVQMGYVACLKILLAGSSSVLNADSKLYESSITALHLAAYMGRSAIVSVLIANVASCTTPDCHGRTALHHVCMGNDDKGNERAEIVALLLGAGGMSVLDSKDNYGDTATIIAAEHNQVGCLRALISAGCAVNITNPVGRSAYHLAGKRGYKHVQEVLINAGAFRN